jgi:drug/metabolite transporter (DMT)-like permease
LFCFLAFIGNGTIMTLSKSQQMLMPGKEMKEFLVLAFGTSSLLSLIIYIFKRIKTHDSVSHLKNGYFLLLVIAAGITTAFGNQIALYLSGRIPAVIQFPTVSGGTVLVSSLFSVILFKEKLSRKGVAGLVLGLAALVLLSIK